jgi:hypothetical protein
MPVAPECFEVHREPLLSTRFNIRRKVMAYDDEQAQRSRVVVETPNSRREVTHTEAVRNDRGGISGATVGVIFVVAIASITIVVLIKMN